MPTNNFEYALKKKLSELLDVVGIPAMVYRVKQSRYVVQHCDIKIDSANSQMYSGIECKQLKSKKHLELYFSSHMRQKQIVQMTQVLILSGRRGWLAIRSRRAIYGIPWATVTWYFNRGARKIPAYEIEKYYCISGHAILSNAYHTVYHYFEMINKIIKH